MAGRRLVAVRRADVFERSRLVSIRAYLTFCLHWLAQHHPRLSTAVTLACGLATGLLWWASISAGRCGHMAVAVLLGAAAAGAITGAGMARRSLHADALTGLPTRAAYTTILAGTRRPTGRRRIGPLTVGLADADGLHQINHVLGHAAGDQYLIALARRLRAVLPASSLLLRLGGDEFAVLDPSVDDTVLASAIAKALGAQITIAGHQVALRASAGVATVRTDPGWGLALADAALAGAKLGGGNQVAVFDAARDGVPGTDGTRPRLRRRETRTATRTTAVVLDGPTVTLPLSDGEARAVLAALRTYTVHHSAPTGGSRPDPCKPVDPVDTDRPVDTAEVGALVERLSGLLHAGSLSRRRTGGEPHDQVER